MAAALVQSLIVSLLLTLILEELFALAWGLRGRDLKLVFLLNLLTNPLAVSTRFALCRLWGLPEIPVVLAIESLVVLTEGGCCRALSEKLRHPWAFALAVNLFSYGTGVLLQTIL
ncbi:MAG: hypothetical protein ACI3VN_10175 [Candidatus Onthomonas sp.]